jgi:hypothetical protein
LLCSKAFCRQSSSFKTFCACNCTTPTIVSNTNTFFFIPLKYY